MSKARYRFIAHTRTCLADMITPVAIYLKLRDLYPGSLLLESADSRGSENSFSYICCGPLARFRVQRGAIETYFPGGARSRHHPDEQREVLARFEEFRRALVLEDSATGRFANGLFGYMTFEAVEHFEDITLKGADLADGMQPEEIPEIQYSFFRYVIAIDHFRDEMHLICNVEEYETESAESLLDALEAQLRSPKLPELPFQLCGEEKSNFSDQEFAGVVEQCKRHIFRGDVFQIVPSRRFSRRFIGDEFNVYRRLRSINPSPYLFFFDCGGYKIFGSSPEAQLVIRGDQASIFPIAGTYARSGDEKRDLEMAERLKNDAKENAEHVMLVDLARNDLSRHCRAVQVESFKDIHFYSHVIHLVSKVTGTLKKGGGETLAVLADSFPAGTLSGAPKHRAMQLINQFEGSRRGFYGGCLGFFGLNGDCNHAIVIRSFLSQGQSLYYQAGAGVVAASDPLQETQEVHNKLGALRRALNLAQEASRQ